MYLSILAVILLTSACAGATPSIKVVCTTSVIMDPATFIGGDRVEAISIADPALCPHLQSDIIPSRIQLHMDFIRDADLFMAYNDSNDRKYNIPAVEDFMKANGYGAVSWNTTSNPSRGWNTPENAELLAAEVKGWLQEFDPANSTYYEERYGEYTATFDAVKPTEGERETLNDTEVIVMLWQREPVQSWLGMKVVDFFAPEFAMNGTKTVAKLVDGINSDPEKYRNVSFVIENMQSGEMAKGIEEALRDHGINATRIIFTNFPGSLDGVNTMADVLNHNKQLVL